MGLALSYPNCQALPQLSSYKHCHSAMPLPLLLVVFRTTGSFATMGWEIKAAALQQQHWTGLVSLQLAEDVGIEVYVYIDIFIQLREVRGAESCQNDIKWHMVSKRTHYFSWRWINSNSRRVWSGDHRLSSRGAGLPWLQLSSSSGWTMAPFGRGLGAVVHRPKHLEFHGWKLREREFWGLFAAWSVCFFPLRKSLEESESLNRWLIYIYINITYYY